MTQQPSDAAGPDTRPVDPPPVDPRPADSRPEDPRPEDTVVLAATPPSPPPAGPNPAGPPRAEWAPTAAPAPQPGWSPSPADPWRKSRADAFPHTDLALGGAWLLAGLLEVTQRVSLLDVRSMLAALMVTAAMSTAVALHRRAPGLALGLVWLGCAVQVTTRQDILLSQLGVAVVAYGCARYGSGAVLWASGLSMPAAYLIGSAYVLYRGTSLSVLLDYGRGISLAEAVGPGLIVFAASSLLMPVPWLIGLVLRSRERLVEGRREQADSERLRALAEEQRAHAEEVSRVREQQARLARDVHDVVGHSLAVIVAQAESAQYLPDDPARLKETFAAIADVARVSLRDVRRVLATGPDDVPAPPPGGLDDLVEGVRASGTLVREVTSGTPVPLADDVALVAYRVLQEMLTNAIKHGVKGEPVTVSRLWQSDGLLLEVTNRRAQPTSGRGGGLEGMLRRVNGVRGSLRVLEDETTFVARVWLPLAPASGPGTA